MKLPKNVKFNKYVNSTIAQIVEYKLYSVRYKNIS